MTLRSARRYGKVLNIQLIGLIRDVCCLPSYRKSFLFFYEGIENHISCLLITNDRVFYEQADAGAWGGHKSLEQVHLLSGSIIRTLDMLGFLL